MEGHEELRGGGGPGDTVSGYRKLQNLFRLPKGFLQIHMLLVSVTRLSPLSSEISSLSVLFQVLVSSLGLPFQ